MVWKLLTQRSASAQQLVGATLLRKPITYKREESVRHLKKEAKR